MDEREAPGNASGGEKATHGWLRAMSWMSLVGNVLVLVVGGPLMGWVCGRLSDAYSRLGEPLPGATAWFFNVSWTKMTVGGLVLAATLIVMERKVRRPGVTLMVHLIVTAALGVLIGAFIYAMMLPMVGMVDETGFS
ncbi:MAG: hypothetical protein ACYC26_13615 [Phycisphaerales bacterium]